MPAGSGRLFKSSIERLHLDLSRHIEDAFSGEEYRQRRKLIIEETQAAQGQLLNRASSHAREQGFAFSMSASGATLIPLKNDRPVSEEDFQALPNEEREELRRRHFEVMQQIEPILEAVHELDHQAQGRLAKLEGDVAELAAKRAFEPIESQVGSPQAVEFLRELRSHAVEHVDSFREPSHRRTEEALPPPPPEQSRAPQVPIPFVVNVFVDNSGIDSPPIVVEDNPTFSNLFGRIDRVFLYGAYVTNHTLLRAGSISRANGGYLVLPLRQLLANPL
ncbi:MAG: lonB, partial [Dehalococcoidia bacterium]|nr:lonB [Dehalococcoidia bacterium]